MLSDCRLEYHDAAKVRGRLTPVRWTRLDLAASLFRQRCAVSIRSFAAAECPDSDRAAGPIASVFGKFDDFEIEALPSVSLRRLGR